VGRRYLEFLSLTFSRFGTSRLVVALIWAIGFAFYLEILTRHPLMYGIDGPYYLVQVRSLLETGRLEYGDPPLPFVLFAIFSIIFGGDLALGIKVCVAIFWRAFISCHLLLGQEGSALSSLWTCRYAGLHLLSTTLAPSKRLSQECCRSVLPALLRILSPLPSH